MSHHHPEPSRKKKGKSAPTPITHADIEMALRAFKEKGGLIKKLHDERVVARQKVGVGPIWQSPYEDITGVDIP